MPEDPARLGRPERRRRQRAREFVEAAKRIIADDGFEGLTMARLAGELDTVVSAVYRYFPSKGALIAEIQREGIESMSASLTRATERLDAAASADGLDERAAATAQLVMAGRWLCAATVTYPEELRLFQLIMSQRASVLDAHGGERIFPIAMQLLGQVVAIIDAAQRSGAIDEGSAIDRAVILASALSGVIQTDDLEHYAPELFGGTRLAQLANLDLLAGWGVPRDALARASELVDALGATGPLAP